MLAGAGRAARDVVGRYFAAAGTDMGDPASSSRAETKLGWTQGKGDEGFAALVKTVWANHSIAGSAHTEHECRDSVHQQLLLGSQRSHPAPFTRRVLPPRMGGRDCIPGMTTPVCTMASLCITQGPVAAVGVCAAAKKSGCTGWVAKNEELPVR